MPANLTPEYLESEERFKKASSHSEKIEALEAMLRTIPKHKGTEKMQADIKRRLSRLRKESQRKGPVRASKPFYHVDREGVGQVVLCGPPNGGKSQLLKNLTQAEPKVAEYPFTTRAPQPGMMPFEDIQIQLVDTPALAPETLEPWQLPMIQQADAVLLVFDVNALDLLDQTEFVLRVFQERGISLQSGQKPPVIVLGNKAELSEGKQNFSAWQELYRAQFQAHAFSALSEENLNQIRHLLFASLKIVRVYTHAPGKKSEKSPTPFVLKRGSTILDAARVIHKDLARSFKFARVWGQARFDGQMVERGYLLEDGDRLEIHG